jgi:hypothetical protein
VRAGAPVGDPAQRAAVVAALVARGASAAVLRDLTPRLDAADAFVAVSPDGCNRAAKSMLDQLTWWGHALRDARARTPYGG